METLLYLSLLMVASSAAATETFDPSFMFGAASSAPQIEGAWDEDGKGESIWDYFAHHNSSLFDHGATPDEACDSYHKWKEDVKLLRELGVSHYRFSISWPRLLPTGFEDNINMKAVQYYQSLLAELKKYNIKSMVTLYHWDLPISLHELGGWTNPKIVEYFTDYVRIVAEYFTDVDYWITINEPQQICLWGYGDGTFAPFIKKSGTLDYECAYNLLKAHAEAYHLLKSVYPTTPVSMAMHLPWAEPFTNVQSDKDAAERYRQFAFGLYAHPILLGGWPSVVSKRIQERSGYENRSYSRLPQFTQQEKLRIMGTADFIGVNYYTTSLVSETNEDPDFSTPSYHKDVRVETTKDVSWELGEGGMTIVPDGMYELLLWIKETYGSKAIMITENGLSDRQKGLNDTQREYFIVNHLHAIWKAINYMQVDVIGYTHWSLMDNFEWRRGYSSRYGLYSVNFTSPDKTRTAKSSVKLYKDIISSRWLPVLATTTRQTTTPLPTTTHKNAAATFESATVLLTVLLCIYKIVNLA